MLDDYALSFDRDHRYLDLNRVLLVFYLVFFHVRRDVQVDRVVFLDDELDRLLLREFSLRRLFPGLRDQVRVL